MDNTIVDAENTLIDLERQFDHKYFLQVLEQGEAMNIPPSLQTLASEEKNPKSKREEASSLAMETNDELFDPSKRPKLNPVFEHEESIALEEITDTETMGQRSEKKALSGETQQPSTSNTQMTERHQNMEVSSFVRPVEKENYIKDRFKEIKMRNEKLKAETYAQYLNLTPPNQTRLM